MATEAVMKFVLREFLLTTPLPSDAQIQGLIITFGLPALLEGLNDVYEDKLKISSQSIFDIYTDVKIITNIPSAYFKANSDIADVLMASVKVDVDENENVIMVPRFAKLKDLYDIVLPTIDTDNLADWVSKYSNQKISLTEKVTAPALATILLTYFGVPQGAHIESLDSADSDKIVNAVVRFCKIVKDVTVDNLKSAGFTWRDLLVSGKYISSLKATYNKSGENFTLNEIYKLVGQQQNVYTSQLPKYMTNLDLSVIKPKSRYYIFIKLVRDAGFSNDEILTKVFDEISDLDVSIISNVAADVNSLLSNVVKNKSLLDRLSLLSHVNRPSSALLLVSDTVLDIYSVIKSNIGSEESEKQFYNDSNNVPPVTFRQSDDYTAPSVENLQIGGIIKFIINNLRPGEDVNDFFSLSKFVEVYSSFFYLDKYNLIISKNVDSFNSLNELNNDNLLAVIAELSKGKSNDVKLEILVNNITNTSDSDSIAFLLSLVKVYGYEMVFNLTSAPYSFNKDPLTLIVKYIVNNADPATMSDLLAFSEVDLAKVQDVYTSLTLEEKDSFINKFVFGNYDVDKVILILGENAASDVKHAMVNNDVVTRGPAYKDILHAIGIVKVANVFGSIPKQPVVMTVESYWPIPFLTSVDDLTLIFEKGLGTAEDILTYTVTQKIVSGDRIISDGIEKIAADIKNLMDAFELTCEQLKNAFEANNMTYTGPC